MNAQRFRVAQKVFLIRKDGKVLVLRFSGNKELPKVLHGKWDFPGGGLEFEEALTQGLGREIEEEIGRISYTVREPIAVGDWIHRDDQNLRTVCVFYLAHYHSGEIVLNREHDAYRWLEPGELSKLPWPKKDMALVEHLIRTLERVGREQVRRGEKCPFCGRRFLRHVAVDPIGVRDGRIVLIRRSKAPDKGKWALPGGMLDWDESAEEGVVREFEEETSLRAELGRFVGVYSGPTRDDFERVSVVYEVKIVGGRLRAGDDAADARWFPLDALPELAVDHGKMIEDYKKSILNINT